MKKILVIMAIIIALGVGGDANLGSYVESDNITYSVVCHTDEGNTDDGCSSTNSTLYAPNGTLMGFRTLTELSDDSAPGYWYGSYIVNATAEVGTWSIYIRTLNSNSTRGGTVKQFQVVESDAGFNNLTFKLDAVIEGNVNLSGNASDNAARINLMETETIAGSRYANITSNQSTQYAIIQDNFSRTYLNFTDVVVHGDINWTSLNSSVTSLALSTEVISVNDTMKLNFTRIYDNLTDIIVHGDVNWTTAKGFQTEVNAVARYSNTTSNFTDVVVHGDINWTTSEAADCETETIAASRYSNITSNQSTQYAVIQDNFSRTYLNFTDVVIHGDVNWTTAKGFQTEVNAVARYTNITSNFTDVVVHGDINWTSKNSSVNGLALSTEVVSVNDTVKSINGSISSNISDIATRGDANWITATGFQTESDASARYTNTTANFTDVVVHGDINWTSLNSSVSGLARTEEVTSVNDTVKSNATDIVVHGDTNWTTAEGFQTETDASARYNNLSSNMSDNAARIIILETESVALSRYDNLTSNFSDNAVRINLMETEAIALSRYDNLSSNQTNIIDTIVTVIQGLNNLSFNDIWVTGTPRLITGGNLTTPDDYKSNATIENQNTIIANASDNAARINAMETETVASSRYDNLTNNFSDTATRINLVETEAIAALRYSNLTSNATDNAIRINLMETEAVAKSRYDNLTSDIGNQTSQTWDTLIYTYNFSGTIQNYTANRSLRLIWENLYTYGGSSGW